MTDSQLNRVDTESMITNLISYYELVAEDRDISFEKVGDFHAALGDESLLQRLFANLMSNAIYYAASDSIITIEASTNNIKASLLTHSVMGDPQKTKQSALKSSSLKPSSLKPQHLKIVFTNRLDEPLTQVEADKLFERFYRHPKTNNMHSGTGLGLSIVQAIARAHNGRVSITIKDEYYFQVSVELLIAG